MNDILTKASARNIFFGGTVVFFAIFVLLVADSFRQARDIETANPITDQVAHGKRVWEQHACFDCHTLYGEGARFAPELSGVWRKFNGDKQPDAAREALKAWFDAQPTGVAGRHQMPNFHLSDQDTNDLIAFLAWTGKVNTQGWPPAPSK